jgi:hypothetical protein
MKGTAVAITRHVVAVGLAWLSARGMLSMSSEQMAQEATIIAEAIINLVGAMLTAYAVSEKMLKPVTFRLLGEVQPGEVPPSTHDIAKAREDL